MVSEIKAIVAGRAGGLLRNRKGFKALKTTREDAMV